MNDIVPSLPKNDPPPQHQTRRDPEKLLPRAAVADLPYENKYHSLDVPGYYPQQTQLPQSNPRNTSDYVRMMK